jgi:hypothetical protein
MCLSKTPGCSGIECLDCQQAFGLRVIAPAFRAARIGLTPETAKVWMETYNAGWQREWANRLAEVEARMAAEPKAPTHSSVHSPVSVPSVSAPSSEPKAESREPKAASNPVKPTRRRSALASKKTSTPSSETKDVSGRTTKDLLGTANGSLSPEKDSGKDPGKEEKRT